jgi:hypothetical protein
MTIQKKIVLHALERLDLVDLQGLQGIVLKSLDDALHGVIGDNGGLVKKWSTATINNTLHTIAFSNFAFIGRKRQEDTLLANTSSYLGFFDSTSDTNGTCSFDAARALVQTYVNANGELPPTPNSASFVGADHDKYYPSIWARSTYGDSVQANRRFWSVADATENTQLVNTRSVEGVQFYVRSTGALPAVASNLPQWTLIGRIYQWTLEGGVVSLDDFGIIGYTVFDSILYENGTPDAEERKSWIDYNGNLSRGGLSDLANHLKNILNGMYKNGTNDDQTIYPELFEGYYFQQPYWSLQGITAQIKKMQADDLRFNGTAILTFDSRPTYRPALAADRVKLTKSTVSAANTVNATILVDYTLVDSLGVPSPYVPTDGGDEYDGLPKVKALLSTFAVVGLDDYAGMVFSANINAICFSGNGDIAGDVQNSTTDDLREYDAGGFDIVTANYASMPNTIKIGTVTYTDINGDTQTGVGFLIRKRNWYLNTNVSNNVGKYNTAFTLNLTIQRT